MTIGATRAAAWSAPIVAALLAVAAPGAPTGHDLVDACWRAAFAAAVALAASRARRRPLVLAAALGAATTWPNVAGAAWGFAALAGSLVLLSRPRRSRLLGSLVGAGVAQALLRLEWPEAHGATAALAGGALVVLAASALRRLPARRRRRVLVGAGALTVVAVLAIALSTALVAGRRADAEEAIATAEAGLAAARRGEVTEAADRLGEAEARLRALEDDLSAWTTTPLRALPVAAQHLTAARGLFHAAADAAGAGARTAAGIDLDRVRPRDGRVDLAALRSFAAPLEDALGALARGRRELAATDSPWLTTPAADQVDALAGHIADAERDLAAAADSVTWMVPLLGGDGARRWFVAATSPAELRNGGGFIGSWAVLTADGGALALTEMQRAPALVRRTPAPITVSAEYDAFYPERWQLARFPQNLMASPDFPSNAEAVADVAEHAGLGRVDGVIAIDPVAVAALLELTGPIEVPWLDRPLTAENAAGVLLHEQYLRAQDTDRRDFLEDVVREVFQRLTGGAITSPARLADVLGPMVRSNHVQLHAFDPGERAFLERRDATTRLVPPVVDGLTVSASEATASKLDWFVTRRIAYDVEHDEATGATSAVVTVRYRNDAPAGLPDNGYLGDPDDRGIGTAAITSTLHSPLGLTEVRLDGRPIGSNGFTELGHHATEVVFDLAPGAERTLRYRLDGRLPAGAYQLDLRRQPTVEPDQLTVTLNGARLHDGPFRGDLRLRPE